MRPQDTKLVFLLKAIFDKENRKAFSTWIGIIVGGLNTLVALNAKFDFINDTDIADLSIILSLATCIAAFYLVFTGVPAIAEKRQGQKRYPEI